MFRTINIMVLGALSFWACKGPSSTTAYVSIENPSKREVYIMTVDSLGFKDSHKIAFDDNSVATITLDLPFSIEYLIESSLIDTKLRLFLRKGDSVGVSILKIGDTFKYEISGKDKWFQNYLLGKDSIYNKFESNLWQIVPLEFQDKLTHYNDSLALARDTLSFDQELFVYDSITDWSRSMSLQLKKFRSGSTLDTSRVRGLFSQLNYYDPRLRKSIDFNNFIYDLQTLFVTLNQWQNEHLTEQELLALTSKNMGNLNFDSTIIEWMRAVVISHISEYGINGDLGNEYNQFISSANTNSFIDALDKRAQRWRPVAKGSKAPDLSLITTTGDTVQLSQFFGRYIYLDLWAGWCKPCIYEFPHSLTTMLDSRFKDFTFLFINMDADQNIWKAGLDRFDIPEGIQLFIPGEFENELFEKYNQTALPRYIIIDPKGNIVDAHAPRPSQREKIYLATKESL